jgi:membrane protein required for colicin V production
LNWFDITIIVGLLVATAAGFFWGLIRQVVSVFGLFIAIWLAAHYYSFGANMVSPFFQDETARNAAGFLLIAIGVSLGIGIAASAAQLASNLILFGLVDHILGAVFGFIQFLILVEVVVVAGTLFPTTFLQDAIGGSKFAPILLNIFSFIISLFPPDLQQIWNNRPR